MGICCLLSHVSFRLVSYFILLNRNVPCSFVQFEAESVMTLQGSCSAKPLEYASAELRVLRIVLLSGDFRSRAHPEIDKTNR